MKIAFGFPAQGAQYVGMGKNLFDNNEIVRKTYEEASSILDLDISDISFNGGIERTSKRA